MYYKLAQDLETNPTLKDSINHKMYEESRKKVKQEARILTCPTFVSDYLRRKYTCHRNVAEIEREFINEA